MILISERWCTAIINQNSLAKELLRLNDEEITSLKVHRFSTSCHILSLEKITDAKVVLLMIKVKGAMPAMVVVRFANQLPK